jgi:hypothetical protein
MNDTFYPMPCSFLPTGSLLRVFFNKKISANICWIQVSVRSMFLLISFFTSNAVVTFLETVFFIMHDNIIGAL